MGRLGKILMLVLTFFLTLICFRQNVFGAQRLPGNYDNKKYGHVYCVYETNTVSQKVKGCIKSDYDSIKVDFTAYTNDKNDIFVISEINKPIAYTNAYKNNKLSPEQGADNSVVTLNSGVSNVDLSKLFYDSSKKDWKGCPSSIYVVLAGNDINIPFVYTNKPSKNIISGLKTKDSCVFDVKLTTSLKDENGNNMEADSTSSQICKKGDNCDYAHQGTEHVKEDGTYQSSLTDTTAIKNWANGKKNGQFKKDNTNSSCGDVINQDVKDFLNQLFTYITIAGVILIVVMSMVSGIKVITLSEEKAIRSFFKSIWVRVVCLIILLLLPMLVSFTISTVNNIAKIPGVNSNDPTCGVGK